MAKPENGRSLMLFARANQRSAILCATLLAICTLASYPFAEMGGNDDFAYVRSAKALADTGHLVYFGWSSAMLGWQLALGAFFIKLLGASFTARPVGLACSLSFPQLSISSGAVASPSR